MTEERITELKKMATEIQQAPKEVQVKLYNSFGNDYSWNEDFFGARDYTVEQWWSAEEKEVVRIYAKLKELTHDSNRS